MKSFASDNNAGVCPEVMAALNAANVGDAVAYGADEVTRRLEQKFKETFGANSEAYFVFNGTAANVLSIKTLIQPYHAVICSETAHINNDECGAPESLTGSKLIAISTTDGKLTPELIRRHLGGRGDQHHVQPRLVSISQATELGTVYSQTELKALSEFCRREGLLLHVDGARLANAAAFLKCNLRDITSEVGVDVLSFGATKNGALGAEAVVFFDRALSKDFKFVRKQLMQLASKMRFVAAQFEALLGDELWRRNALQANSMAQRLADGVKKMERLNIVQPVQANGVFVQVPPEIIAPLQEKYFFYVWNEGRSEVRWMTAFNTTAKDVDDFLALLDSLLS